MSQKMIRILFVISGIFIVNTLLNLLNNTLLSVSQQVIMTSQSLMWTLLGVVLSSTVYIVLLIVFILINNVSKHKLINPIDYGEYYLFISIFLMLSAITSFIYLLPGIYSSFVSIGEVNAEYYTKSTMIRLVLNFMMVIIKLGAGTFFYSRSRRADETDKMHIS